MSTMTSVETRWRKTDRAGWILWGITFVLLLSMVSTLQILYLFPGDQAAHNIEGWVPPNPWVLTGSLMGLVMLFCLYTVVEQRHVNDVRRRLEREEDERVVVSTRLSELSALFQLSTALQLELRLDLVLEIIVRRMVSVLQAQQASVMLLDPETQELVTRTSYGLEAELALGGRQRMGGGIAGRVAQRREAVLLGHEAPSPELARHYKSDRNITSAVSLPLAVGDRVIGVLNVNRIHSPEPFDRHHLELLRTFGEHIAAVIERAEMVEKLDERARALEADNGKLADLNRMKDLFLSTASHELKTPLSAVIAYAELLDDHEGRLSREQSREFVGRLRGEAVRLLGLIEDILDLSRLESGKLVLKPRAVSLAETARGALDTTRIEAERHGVTLVAEMDGELPALEMDEVKIRQVVVNLLVNAVKFSPRGGAVTLRTRRDGNWARLEVSDQGPGVPPESAAQIFELFGQGAGEAAMGRGGLGIGLHLVKRLTELHGGQAGVSSLKEPGTGSTFWVRLPLPASRDDSRPLEDAA